MGGEEERYAWLALVAKLQWRCEWEDDPPAGIVAMTLVEAVAGRLSRHDRNAANDVAARVVLSLLILLLIYAKFRAKMRELWPFLSEIRDAPICCEVAANPAQLLAARVFVTALLLSHFDHLLWGGVRNGTETGSPPPR